MKQTSLPSYNAISRVLRQVSLEVHPAQLHGLLCGLLCGSANKESVLQKLSTEYSELTTVQEDITEILDINAKQLEEFSFEFQVLLPLDSQGLAKRAEALTLWCQGFLTGLGLENVPLTGRSPSEMTEAINDLIEIAKMNYEDVVANEEDEAAYMHLVEYVRMAVILIYQELHKKNDAESIDQTEKQLH